MTSKADIEAAVAADTGLSKKDVAKVVDGFLEALGKTLAAGEEVRLPGFGVFSVKEAAEKQGRNPRTGETITIAAAKKAAFKPAKQLADSVNGKGA